MDNQIEKINRLEAQLNSLSAAFYKNNFSSSQDFNKACNFNYKVKLPIYTTLPSAEVGELCIYSTGGTYKLMVCTATDTWTIAGTQS